jgi:hypothetical protein
VCLILTAGASFRQLDSAVSVEIVAGLPAESPGSSQLVVGIVQSSRGYSECRAWCALQAAPSSQGTSSALHLGLWNCHHWWICSMGPPALLVLNARAFQRAFFVRTPVLNSGFLLYVECEVI